MSPLPITHSCVSTPACCRESDGPWGILQLPPPPPSFLTPIQGGFFHQGFGFHLPCERENREREQQNWVQQGYMGIDGKAASDNHKKSFVPIKLCRGVTEQPYLFGQEYPGDSLPQGAGRDLLAGRCLGHPLRPQCPWVLLGLSFSLFCWAVGPPTFCCGSMGILLP